VRQRWLQQVRHLHRGADEPRFWVNYSADIALIEALTQIQVAKIVNAEPESVVCVPEACLVFSRMWCRQYIIMQHIEGTTVASRQSTTGTNAQDDLAVVVKQFTDIRMPAETPPGHIGGEPIGHSFFVRRMQAIARIPPQSSIVKLR
jgi:hypothetical protein